MAVYDLIVTSSGFPLPPRADTVRPMLTLTSLHKRYGGLVALDDVSLEIPAGTFFGLLGPNGAGKSTLMSLVAALKQPDGGSIAFEGRPVTRDTDGFRRQMGLVPQAIALYPELTAEENLRVFGELQGLRGAELRARIDEALTAVQLQDRRNSPVKTFSGGMQRRLNLVAALLHRPKVLLCDEPTVGVDPQSRNAIFDHLEALNRQGLTVIYSTHYMEEAERLCSRIGIIDHGRILALGSVGELLARQAATDEITFAATPEIQAALPRLETLGRAVVRNGRVHFQPREHVRLSEFFALTETLGLPSQLFELQRPTLEAVFLHLTGRTLRD